MDHFAEILFALNKHCFSYLSIWIKEAMQQDGFPSARVSPEQKETFSQQILRLVSPVLCCSCSVSSPTSLVQSANLGGTWGKRQMGRKCEMFRSTNCGFQPAKFHVQ